MCVNLFYNLLRTIMGLMLVPTALPIIMIIDYLFKTTLSKDFIFDIAKLFEWRDILDD